MLIGFLITEQNQAQAKNESGAAFFPGRPLSPIENIKMRYIEHLNAEGISIEGLSDKECISAYNVAMVKSNQTNTLAGTKK